MLGNWTVNEVDTMINFTKDKIEYCVKDLAGAKAELATWERLRAYLLKKENTKVG